MKRLGEYRSYLLYEVEEQDGIDINTSSGSRYIRNSILIFESGGNGHSAQSRYRGRTQTERTARGILLS